MWDKQCMCVHMDTLYLLVCTSRVKRPFSGPIIFVDKIYDLLFIINSLIGMFIFNC